MDTEDRSELHGSSEDAKNLKENDPAASRIKENRVLEQSGALEDSAQDSPPSTPMSEVYSLKDNSSDSVLTEIDDGNVAEKTKESESVACNSDRDEPSEDSDASIDVRSSPKQEMDSLKDDLLENSTNLEPVEDDDDSPKSETAEQVKEVVVSASKIDEHEASVQRYEEVEASINPEPLMVAGISPKSDTDDEVKEVVVFESKKEDCEGSEDSELLEDAAVIPEVENDSTSSGNETDGSEDDSHDKTNDKTSSEPPEPVEKADHANQRNGSPESHDNEGVVPAKLPEQDQKTKEPSMKGKEKEQHPALDGRQVSEIDCSADETAKSSEALAIKNFVQEASVGAVSSVMCLSGSKCEEEDDKPMNDRDKDSDDSSKHTGIVEDSPKQSQRSFWRPLSSYFRFSQDTDQGVYADKQESIDDILQPIPTKGQIIFYTRLGCRECKEGRLYLHAKRLRYVEINVDLYPGRKLELEKISGSPAVPKIFFNEILIGDVNDLKRLDESGKLQEKIDYIVNEPPQPEAPLPPLSGEDDLSGSGSIDELAVIVRKMQDSIVVKDRFHMMRRITNCFLGSEAIDFISEDQYLQREEAIQFARKLANNLFFHSVLEENVFEDGNHLYRFLDDDPIVSSQCYNIPRGIIDVKPKPITEIASRLRFLSYAIFDAYTSEDGRHVDYRSIHGSEEFARYIRTVEQLQRVDMQGMLREERLAFFINLYNMMAIHAILVLGHPTGALERRRLFVDFQYIVGGCTYSLSAIQNGILRGNQRPPYSLMKPFGAKDKRSKVALPYPEQLTHFALVCGTRSGPALRCYSPGNIDKELMDAARDFLRNGGFIYDAMSNVASVTKILKWFSVDFGKTEVEVMKHASNYLEPADSEMLLDLLSANQLKVTYQPYDWGLNC